MKRWLYQIRWNQLPGESLVGDQFALDSDRRLPVSLMVDGHSFGHQLFQVVTIRGNLI